VRRKCLAGLMKAAGLQGVSRRKASRTTVRCSEGCPTPDLVERDFAVPGADRLWGANITCISTWAGFSFFRSSGCLEPQDRRLGDGPRTPPGGSSAPSTPLRAQAMECPLGTSSPAPP
jgi:hypothetical protein